SLGVTKKCFRRIDLERSAIGGNSPVVEKAFPPKWILSTAEHEEFRRNLGEPSLKAKYSLVTDSEPVPRGKGEKHPGRGEKEHLKPGAYKEAERHERVTADLLQSGPASDVCRQGQVEREEP